VIVSGRPAKAGIDPDNKLIDRKPDDNMINVELQAQ
jgi:ABC-2 type transport system permease protein